MQVFGRNIIPSDLLSDMVLGLKFEDNLDDYTGNNIITSFGDNIYPTGLVGKSRNFDGFGDYLQMPHSSDFDLQGDFTMCGIINITNFNQNNPKWLFTKSNALTNGWFLIYGNNTDRNLVFSLRNSTLSNTTVSSSTQLIMGNDYRYAIRATSTTLDLFINGQLDASVTYNNPPETNTQKPTIGAASWALGPNTCHGQLDEIKLYTRALTNYEISKINNEESNGNSIMI